MIQARCLARQARAKADLCLRLSWRSAFLATTIGSVALCASFQVEAQMATSNFDIPAQPLPSALLAFSNQSGVSVALPHDLAAGRMSRPLTGTFSSADALKRLLDGTGLRFEFVDPTTVKIEEGQPEHRSETPARNSPKPVAAQSRDEDSTNAPEEIVVTAQKRLERLQDVPVPVSVVYADALVETNQVLLKDYYSSVPSLNLTPNILGIQSLTIRGITTGDYTIPTAGIVIDDVPYGSSADYQGGVLPDLDPGDLDRIEVLRGPQGTLYGANSMGGLVKFVTKDPSTSGYSGRAEVGIDTVHNGAEPGYNFRASANIPFGETLAIRVSGFTRQEAGYIDDVLTHASGVNETHADGARLSALWRPSDELSVKLSALYQSMRQDGTSDAYKLPGLGDLQENSIAGSGKSNYQVQAYSAVVKYDLGIFDLTSITGYNFGPYHDNFDGTYLFGQCCTLPNFETTATFVNDYGNDRRISEELRLSGTVWQDFDWLVGAFYEHENIEHRQSYDAANPITGNIVGQLGYFSAPYGYEEYAGFADLTYRITDWFDVQAGVRESRTTLKAFAEFQTGPLEGGSSTKPPAEATGNALTYLLTPRVKLSPDLMLYASALTQTEGTGRRSSLARMSLAGLVQTKGFGLALCSSR